MVDRRKRIHRTDDSSRSMIPSVYDDQKQTIRILVIDDEIDHLHQLRSELGDPDRISSEYNISLSLTHDYACEAVLLAIGRANSRAEFPYDVVISDIFMPSTIGSDDVSVEHGGTAIYDAINAKRWRENPLLILITNRLEDAAQSINRIAQEQASLDAPWCDHILKPTTMGRIEQPLDDLAYIGTWRRLVWDCIAKCKEVEHRQRLSKLRFNELRFIPQFEKLFIDLHTRTGAGKAFAVVGERGSGIDQVTELIAELSCKVKDKRHVPSRCSLESPSEVWSSQLFGSVSARGRRQAGLLDLAGSEAVVIEDAEKLMELCESDDPQQRLAVLRLTRLLSETREFQANGHQSNAPSGKIRQFGGTSILLWKGKSSDADATFRAMETDGIDIVRVPSLREYIDSNIHALVQMLVHRISRKTDIQVSPDGIAWLKKFSWPGNLLQLEQVLSAAVHSLTASRIITSDDLKQLSIIGAKNPGLARVWFRNIRWFSMVGWRHVAKKRDGLSEWIPRSARRNRMVFGMVTAGAVALLGYNIYKSFISPVMDLTHVKDKAVPTKAPVVQ